MALTESVFGRRFREGNRVRCVGEVFAKVVTMSTNILLPPPPDEAVEILIPRLSPIAKISQYAHSLAVWSPLAALQAHLTEMDELSAVSGEEPTSVNTSLANSTCVPRRRRAA